MIVSCGEEPKQEKDLNLIKSDFSELEGWKQDNINQAIKAFKKSCNKIKLSKAEYIDSTSEIKIQVKDYKDLCLRLEKQKHSDYKKFIVEGDFPSTIKQKKEELQHL